MKANTGTKHVARCFRLDSPHSKLHATVRGILVLPERIRFLMSRLQKRSLYRPAAYCGVLNPQEKKEHVFFKHCHYYKESLSYNSELELFTMLKWPQP